MVEVVKCRFGSKCRYYLERYCDGVSTQMYCTTYKDMFEKLKRGEEIPDRDRSEELSDSVTST